MSLRRLRLERIELYHLHRIDPEVPLTDQLGELDSMRAEGKIARIGLSEVSLPQLVEARMIAPIASVQNRYNVYERRSQAVLDYCASEGIVFIPWAPIAAGRLGRASDAITEIATQTGYSAAQIALSWLLHCGDVVVPIPGTGSLEHLAENIDAAAIELTADQVDMLDSVT
jgi:pyridoxine 4-dehydrogenase